jgi:hypothetical protein
LYFGGLKGETNLRLWCQEIGADAKNMKILCVDPSNALSKKLRNQRTAEAHVDSVGSFTVNLREPDDIGGPAGKLLRAKQAEVGVRLKIGGEVGRDESEATGYYATSFLAKIVETIALFVHAKFVEVELSTLVTSDNQIAVVEGATGAVARTGAPELLEFLVGNQVDNVEKELVDGFAGLAENVGKGLLIGSRLEAVEFRDTLKELQKWLIKVWNRAGGAASGRHATIRGIEQAILVETVLVGKENGGTGAGMRAGFRPEIGVRHERCAATT